MSFMALSGDTDFFSKVQFRETMIRDNNKDKAYFDGHIALNDAAIAKRLDVETFPNVKGRVGRAYTLVHDAFIGCIYRFSRGDSLEDIR